jgi:SAM-dependent methyltransferase
MGETMPDEFEFRMLVMVSSCVSDEQISDKLRKILEIGKCPRTGLRLQLTAEGELGSTGGEWYPIVSGKPVLVRNVEALHTTPPAEEVISKNSEEFYPVFPLGSDSILLHLGCGDVPSRDPRVISLDILPTNSADLVAEAEALPFQDDSFDFVVSGAVFEHLYDPLAAAAEVRRVLKPGGCFYIDTAFMQSYHGFPSHYFNMTPQAVETFIVDDFILEDSFVPDSATLLTSLTSLFDRFIELLPKQDAARLLALPLSEALEALRSDRSSRNPLLREISSYSQRSMAASFVVIARKPGNPSHEFAGSEIRARRRAYYAARNAVIFRHHEMELYCRLTHELGVVSEIGLMPSLSLLLAETKIVVPSDMSFASMTRSLERIEAELVGCRNQWIGAYMAACS